MVMFNFLLFSYTSFSYILDNSVNSYVSGRNPGFPLRAGGFLTDYELHGQIWFPVSPTDVLHRCKYLVCK